MPRKKKDLRYEVVKAMLEKKKVKRMSDIIKYIPHTVVAGDLGKNNNVVRELFENPGKMKIHEVYKLSELIEWDFRKILNIIANDFD